MEHSAFGVWRQDYVPRRETAKPDNCGRKYDIGNSYVLPLPCRDSATFHYSYNKIRHDIAILDAVEFLKLPLQAAALPPRLALRRVRPSKLQFLATAQLGLVDEEEANRGRDFVSCGCLAF